MLATRVFAPPSATARLSRSHLRRPKTFLMHAYRRYVRMAIAAIGIVAVAQSAHSGDWCRDPQTQHTNGMPIANSVPHRSSWVYWTCDPYHVGACGGRYVGLCDKGKGNHANGRHSTCNCCEDACGVASCPICQQRIWQGEVPMCETAGIEGIEGGEAKLLGEIPSDSVGGIGGGGRVPVGGGPIVPSPPGGFQFTLPGFGLPAGS